MKYSKFFKRSQLCYKSFFALLVTLFILVPSCQKEEFENEMVPTASFMKAVLKSSENAIIYYGAETFKITSKNDPLVAIRTLANPNYKYFEKFMLKVQNGNGNSNKDVILEILIDDVVIVTSADFTKRKNIITKELTGLTPESVLEIRLDGGKNKSITLLIECSLKEDVITDIDGNYYNTVKIGDQWWMAENLKVTKFNDGTPIQNVTGTDTWESFNTSWEPAYCWYNNEVGYKDVYGALYNRGAVITIVGGKNVCSVGWHVAGDSDWTKMLTMLDPAMEFGDSYIAGLKLKETGTLHWSCPENEATNETGFSARPGGFRFINDPAFQGIGETAMFWNGWYGKYSMNCSTEVGFTEGGDDIGLSVRCVKD